MTDRQAAKKPNTPMRMTPGFAFSFVDRCLQECLARRAFGQKEVDQVLKFLFNGASPSCVYCDSPNIQRWDHLIPVARGGETVLGNMVPACARCDDSKQALPFDEWTTSKAKYSPKSRGVADLEARMERIRAYATHFGYEPVALDKRLSDEERARLKVLQKKAAGLREEIEALIHDYNRRTNGKA